MVSRAGSGNEKLPMLACICYSRRMGKRDDRHSEDARGNGGCLRMILWCALLGLIFYLGIHVYFLWQPSGKPGQFSTRVMDSKLLGIKLFPAVRAYPLEGIAGRREILEGGSGQAPMLKERLANAIEMNIPISLREGEVNAWLAQRLKIRQAGPLAGMVEVRGVWVRFREDEIELVIERRLRNKDNHVTSLFMRFERTKRGYSIVRHSCHIGQLRLPGGFARLVMPAYQNMVDELEHELQPYHEHQIFDVRVEDGMITLDPRNLESRL